MSLLEEIYKQRHEFLVRNLTPTVLVVPYEQRHQLIGEAFDHFGPTNFQSMREGSIHIMGLRVMFSRECHQLQVLGGPK